MIVRAYFDESGSHRDSRFLIMGGYVGRYGQWNSFDRAWHRFGKRTGIPSLHTKDAKSGWGPFKGRSVQERHQYLLEAERVANKHLAFRFFAMVDMAEFERAYIGDRRAKIHFDSAYGLCFRACLEQVPIAVRRIMGDPSPHIEFHLEEGHANDEDAVRIFGEFRQRSGDETFKQITFAGKSTPGLQIADAISFAAYQDAVAGTASILSSAVTGELPSYDRKAHGKCPMIAMRLTEDTLRGFRESAVADLERRRAFWQEGRRE